MKVSRPFLDGLYNTYNRREYVHPDPLEFLYDYPALADREIVGLIASSLAYGRVAQILKSVGKVLARMPSPARFLQRTTRNELHETFADFKHRFTTAQDLVNLLVGIQRALATYGSLNRCFQAGLKENTQPTVYGAVMEFSRKLSAATKSGPNSLLPRHDGKSAAKRMNLYLRWMVRTDDVDPGGWEGVPPGKLVVPLDVHMHRVAKALGFTRRNQADGRTAEEVSLAFRAFAPNDAAKYDFALTRFGIWGRKDMEFELDTVPRPAIVRTRGSGCLMCAECPGTLLTRPESGRCRPFQGQRPSTGKRRNIQ